MSKLSKSSKLSQPSLEMEKSRAKDSSEKPHWALRLREVGLVVAVGVSLLMLLALISYTPEDPGWSAYRAGEVRNAVGPMGAWFSDFLLSFLGFFGFLSPVLLVYGVWILKREDHGESPLAQYLIFLMRFFGALFILLGGSGLAAMFFKSRAIWLPQGPGGIIGDLVSRFFMHDFGFQGSALCLVMLLLIGLTFFAGVSWDFLGRMAARHMKTKLKKSLENRLAAVPVVPLAAESLTSPAVEEIIPQSAAKLRINAGLWSWWKNTTSRFTSADKTVTPVPQGLIRREPKLSGLDLDPLKRAVSKPLPPIKPLTSEPLTTQDLHSLLSQTKNVERIEDPMHKIQKFETPVPVSVSKAQPPKVPAQNTATLSHKKIEGLPDINLLDQATARNSKVSDEVLAHTAKLVEEKLADFNVQAKVEGVCPGPVVTRFEIQLAPGVKVSKLAGLSKDLARSLSVMSVRIVEVIPGKTCVGLEVPNEVREMVRLREVLDTKAYQDQESPLTLALGKDIAGKPLLADLGRMPHLLVAGTTGSGKSVGVNAMILSMLFKAGPDALKMIMIDPKMLELSVYEGIPHLLTPVVTDMKQAASALRWCVKEMDDRYRTMATLGVRNIAGLNQAIVEAAKRGEEIMNPLDVVAKMERPRALEKMPYVVVIVDEFADMMMVVGKKVEELIARIAQKARAAGIHLILATQRPSVDVITGLIKANIPTRMAFQVSSKIDSRTILDQQGAEQLLGHGDMLYLPPGSGVPIRVHGAFVADHEVHAVASAWKERGQPNYIQEILSLEDQEEGGGEGEAGIEGTEDDPLYDQAVQIVMETQRASISNVQRRLKIGYNRAARLLEQMQKAGLVSEMQGNGMREILVQNQI